MRIGINASMFKEKNKTGIPTAVENVLRNWSISHPENEYFLFTRKDIYLDFELGDNWHIVSFCKSGSKLVGLLYRTVVFPFQVRRKKLDIFWGPNYFIPVITGAKKNVVSVYDMAMYHFKDTVLLLKRLYYKIMLPISCCSADKILTISRASAQDIHKLLGVRKNKIAISYLGGLGKRSSGKRPFDDKMKPELNIKGRFILFISTIEPRKNIMTLIRAFEKYMDKYNESDLYLILAGGRGWKCDNIYEAVQNSRYKDRIIMPGYISSDEKAYLLQNASVFAYPSLYEGFGIPVLEAFDEGVPVVTTRVSSLPEVGGDAAFYIDDPYDSDALAQRLREVLTLTDEERAELDKKISRQLSKFSWEKNAEEIMNLFKRLAGDRS